MISLCTGNCPISDLCMRYMNDSSVTRTKLEDICIPNDYKEWIPYDYNIQRLNVLNI